MLSNKQINSKSERPVAFIYAVVFNSTFSLLLVFFLLASFAIQPIHQTYANELEQAQEPDPEPVAEDVELQVEDEDPEPELEPEIIEEEIPEVATEESNENTETEIEDLFEEEVDIVEEVESSEIENDASATTTSVSTETEEIIETASTTTPDVTTNDTENETATSTQATGGTTSTDSSSETSTSTTNTSSASNQPEQSTTTPDTALEEVSTSTDSETTTDTGETDNNSDPDSDQPENGSDDSASLQAEEDISEEKATTTTESETEPTVTQAQTLQTEDNYYQFSRNACVAIGGGTYHCSLEAASEINEETVVYAELGANQNTEIFLRTAKGTVRQITDNEFDDSSPHFDAETKQIVWQRLVEDRYQVILYDIEEENETQLTFSRTNNMEPRVSRSGIVWQAWDNHDWEIMYFDGTYTDQITNNDTQDVAPAIDEGYILWSVLGAEEQEARVYSLASGEILTINGYEGGLITNPRFVLVYDTKYDNGDIITQGFDPLTGLSSPIAAKPSPNPIDIPDADSVGETRALIQNKTYQKDKLVELEADDDTSSRPQATSSNATASSTLNLRATTSLDVDQPVLEIENEEEEIIATTSENLVLTDFDLIITPNDSALEEISDTDAATSTVEE